MRVLFLVSGVYPHYVGGVSTWAEQLLGALSEHEFQIVSVVSNPYVELRYVLPPNVTNLVTVPLWGTELVEEYLPGSPRAAAAKRLRTTHARIRGGFVPHFEKFMRQVKIAAPQPGVLGQSIYDMHTFLMDHDFTGTIRSRALWVSYIELLREDPILSTLNLQEAVTILRTIARYLRVLNFRPARADLSHSAIASVAGLVGVVAYHAFGTPSILTEHGVYIRERLLDIINQPLAFPAKVFWQNFHAALARLNYHYADGIFPVCSFNSRWEQQFGVPAEKIRVVYNGVDGDRFRPMDVARTYAGPSIVAVTRLDRLKDALNLIHAMAVLRRSVQDVRCFIYGPAADAVYTKLCLDERTRLGLDGCVEFLGPTSRPEFAYNTGDVVVLSSLSEGFPFALIEAMACGRAIVATDVGGMAEALGDAGLIVPPRQPKRLAEAMLRLLRDRELRAELGMRARRRALAEFSVSEFIEAYRDIYSSVGGAASLRRRN
jgi:glycosyltransferase involved in cell wall biosynthesis